MPKQLAFYFEQKYCVGCNTCMAACKDKNNLNMGQRFRKVYEVSGGEYTVNKNVVVPKIYAFWITISCNHCINPICVNECPTKAIKKRLEDGIVFIDQEKCIGCLRCLKSCPYEAPQYNSATKKVEKCDFCLDFLAQGKDPACVSACPMRALDYGTLDILKRKYGSINEVIGMPSAEITTPALVITPHRDAIISK